MLNRKGDTILEHKIIELYENGEKIQVICDTLGTNPPSIYKLLRDNNIPKRNRTINLSLVQIEDIARRFLDGESNIQIAKDYGLSHTNLYDILKASGVDTKRYPMPIRDTQLGKSVKVDYENRMSLKEIKNKYNFKNDTSVYNIVTANRYNLKK